MIRLATVTIAAATMVAVAEEPHWSGVDTTARQVTQPVAQTTVGTKAITPLWSRVASAGRTIRGYRAPGGVIILR